MGDRGQTATPCSRSTYVVVHLVYPMGDRGQTATSPAASPRLLGPTSLSDGRSGANRNYFLFMEYLGGVYPMGDRGQTATQPPALRFRAEFIRWEIGGKPQHVSGRASPRHGVSLSDGRSGANRNRGRVCTAATVIKFIRWEIGGKPQRHRCHRRARRPRVYPMGDRGQTATVGVTAVGVGP